MRNEHFYLTERQEMDRALGKRLREARLSRGLSQKSLGAAVGISFQQIQKYEQGADRMALSTLLAMERALGTPVENLIFAARGGPSPFTGEEHKSVFEILRLFQKLQSHEQRALTACARILVKGEAA